MPRYVGAGKYAKEVAVGTAILVSGINRYPAVGRNVEFGPCMHPYPGFRPLFPRVHHYYVPGGNTFKLLSEIKELEYGREIPTVGDSVPHDKIDGPKPYVHIPVFKILCCPFVAHSGIRDQVSEAISPSPKGIS